MNLDDYRLDTLGGRVFAMSLMVRPGSVRDSMFRAEQFCQGLLASRKVEPGDRVFVLGLGPTGMTVVASLIDAGAVVQVCAIATAESLSGLQRCEGRHVCPTTYDFPSEHWNGEEYPIEPLQGVIDHGTLAWRRQAASLVYQQIKEGLNDLVEQKFGPDHGYIDHGSLADLQTRQIIALDGSVREEYEVTITLQSGVVKSQPYDVVILCNGPGKHPKIQEEEDRKKEVGGFAGRGWWSDDPVLSDPSLAAGKPVLIAGAGDGGVADFVRLLTGIQDPAECLALMKIPDYLLEALQDPNKKMWTEFPLSTEPDHALLLAAHERAITAVKRAWDTDGDLRVNVRRQLRDTTRRPFVQLAMPCYHFAHCYFGNRAAAHLLARAVAGGGVGTTNGGLMPFRVGARIEHQDITGLTSHDGKKHVCEGNTEKCANASHRVVFRGKCAVCRQDPIGPGGVRPRPIEMPGFVWACMSGDHATVTGPRNNIRETGDFYRVFERYGLELYPTPLPAYIREAIQRKRSMRDVPFFYGSSGNSGNVV